jgi:hypothetical protein
MEKPIFNLVAPEKPIEPCSFVYKCKEISSFENASDFKNFAISFEQENPDAFDLNIEIIEDRFGIDFIRINWSVPNPNYKEEYAKYELALARYKTDLAKYDAFVSASKRDKTKEKMTAYENALNYINTNPNVKAETLVKILNSGNK